MPRQRVSSRTRRRRELTTKQRINLTVGHNCGGVGPGWAFETEEERREAWAEHGGQLLATSRPGRRPAGYWDYDRPELEERRLPHETDLQLLERLDLLTPEERAYCEARRWLPVEPATGEDPRELLGKF